MARLIEAQTRFRGWLEATDALLATGPELNLILSITKPGLDGTEGKTAGIRGGAARLVAMGTSDP